MILQTEPGNLIKKSISLSPVDMFHTRTHKTNKIVHCFKSSFIYAKDVTFLSIHFLVFQEGLE